MEVYVTTESIKKVVPGCYGILNYPNGAVYVGDWKDGKRHGTGTYHHRNDYVYEGAWVKDMKHGRGVMTSANKEAYIGLRWITHDMEKDQ